MAMIPMFFNRDHVPASAQGEKCRMCGDPAARKVEETIFADDPQPVRHEYTAYVCLPCFCKIMGIKL